MPTSEAVRHVLMSTVLQADSVPMENLSLYSSGGAGGRMYPAGQHMVGSTYISVDTNN